VRSDFDIVNIELSIRLPMASFLLHTLIPLTYVDVIIPAPRYYTGGWVLFLGVKHVGLFDCGSIPKMIRL